MRRSALLFALAVSVPTTAAGQDRPVSWQRSGGPTEAPVTVFHSTQAVNLPTAETLRQGEWLFEISHRFSPAISQGSEALWGLDGPVVNRLGLSYAATDRVMLGVLRSNRDDNLELDAKVRVAELDGPVPVMLAVAGGLAWNTEITETDTREDNESQAYGQVLVNALLGDRLAVGVVPTLLHNSDINTAEAENAFVLGLHGQVYVSEQVSFLGEWIVTEERTDYAHDPATFGIELETGGHFFKIVVTNQTLMNPTQVMGGAPFVLAADQLRLGFNVTRLLHF